MILKILINLLPSLFIIGFWVASQLMFVQAFFTVFGYDVSLGSRNGEMVAVANRSGVIFQPIELTYRAEQYRGFGWGMLDTSFTKGLVVVTLPYYLILALALTPLTIFLFRHEIHKRGMQRE